MSDRDRENGTAIWMRHVEAAIDAEQAPPVDGEEEVARTRTIDTIMHRPTPPGLGTTTADAPPRRDSIRYKKRMKRAARAAAADAQALDSQPMAPAIDQAALDGAFATMGKMRAFHASCVQEVEQRRRDTKRKRDAVEDEDEQSRALLDATLHKLDTVATYHRGCLRALQTMRRATKRTQSVFGVNESTE